MPKIKPQPGILDVPLYVGGAGHVAGQSNVLKLSSNENPFGPPESAIKAANDAVAHMHRYPSSDHAALRAAIGEVHGLDPKRVICGAGSDEVFTFLAQAYAGPDREVIYTEHGFAMYPIVARAAGATLVMVAERERVVDVDAILAACNDRTSLVFIANPANPTGTFLGEADVARLADGLPEQAILVLDGAYAEYLDGYDGGLALVESRDNVVMTRTFSKMFGLGGMRIGWGYGPQEIIDVLSRLRGPFNLSGAALAAAEAAIRDTDFIEKSRANNTAMRDYLSTALAEIGVPSDTSTANFILARFASPDEAAGVDSALKSAGITVRRVINYGLPAALRITVGDQAACTRVVRVIADFKGAN